MAWYDAAWSYRRALTVTNSNASALTQFQVQVTLTSSNFDFTVPLTDGSDLRVTDSDQVTLIPYWIQSYDHVAQTATIWVRVPSIGASTTHTLYLYYGNASPATFTLPPTGKFTRPASSALAGLAENMVYDATTNKYYVVYTTLSNTIGLASATTPVGTWTDLGTILGVGGSGQWDSSVVYAPHLLLDGTTWVLYYTGSQNSPNADSLGYATATSVTGPYTKSGSNPVIAHGGAGSWNAARTAECYIYHSGILGKWVCMTMGDSTGGGSPVETIGYWTAAASTGPWTAYASNPVLNLGTAPTWDETEVADPWVVELDGVAYIGYCGTQQTTGAGITGYAVTTDYITFTKVAPIAGWGAANGDWDNFDFFRGGPLLVSGTYYLPYTGNTILAQSAYKWGVASMPAVSTAQGYDPWCVLDFFDDFPGTSLDSAAWGESTAAAGEGGSHSVASSAVTLTIATASGVHTLVGKRQWGPGYKAEFRAKFPDFTASDTNAYSNLGWGYDDGGTIFIAHDYDQATDWGVQTHYGSTYNNGTIAAAADQAYHTFTVAWKDATHCDFSVDGGTATTEPVSIAHGSLKPWLHAQSISGASESLTVDWVRVRKYAASDPTTAVGAQVSGATAAWRAAAARFRLASAAMFKDAGTRFRLAGAAFHDAGTRFRIAAAGSRDAAARFRLASTATYRDVSLRFRLVPGAAFRDGALRFRLASATATRDAALRFRLRATGYRDAAFRFVLQAAGQAYRDSATRFRVAATTTRDAATRFRLASAVAHRDAAFRLRLAAAAYRDALARFALAAGSYRDARLRFVLAIPGYRDAALRLRLAGPGDRDAGFRFSISGGTFGPIIVVTADARTFTVVTGGR